MALVEALSMLLAPAGMAIDSESLNSLATHITSRPCPVDGIPLSALYISSPPHEQPLPGRLFVGDDILPPCTPATHPQYLPYIAPLPPIATQIKQTMTCMYDSCALAPAKTYRGITALSAHLSDVHNVKRCAGLCRFPGCRVTAKKTPGLLVHVLTKHVGLYLKCRHPECTRCTTEVHKMRLHWINTNSHSYDVKGALYDECLEAPTANITH
ncbi:hypothetical protein HYPSUDRAFT_783531 [Hypholoma sublateritium FD-334 SS-4]|uniref:C2H2-type domain-containing protein n=1 Tax=Hypholoma sublateritium (strain FD-334 SS-4) TaxID=945553 RepID=A0A0D2PL59_HYPSF|nr:hypothetical protein HYPSUDRAFT_783531 [Hypholoma sublateritium FD-334 SS-4]